jgi:ElaB/YqjD/DUF883 family membrane-anchored ribosome-binding protein
MSTTSTDPREIEADLERERASLASTLDALSDRVSVDNLAKEALGMLRSYSGTATTSIDHAVRANPLAVALIGAGVAWMFLGSKITGSSSSSKSSSSNYGSGYPASSSSYRSSGYSSGSTGAYSGAYAGGIQHDDAAWAASGTSGSSDYGRVGYVASDNDDDHAWSREAHGLRARAMDALHRIESEAKSYYDSVRNGISNMTSSSGGSRDFDAEREGVISRFSSDLKARLSSGLDNLPEGSRQQVIAARERAYSAMLQAERMGRDAIRNPGQLMEEHPIVAGAVAFALGAAVGAALPSTDVENRTFGAERDRLMNDAARLLRQERETAMRVASSVGSSVTSELKEAATETLQAVTETVTDRAQQAATRVTQAAGQELNQATQQGGSSSSSSSSSYPTGGTSGGSGLGSSPSLRGPGDPTI